MKKILSTLLSILVLVTLIPVSAMALGEITLSSEPTDMSALHAGDKVTITVVLPEFTTPKLQFDLLFDDTTIQ